jgi:beta-ketoacyl-acyl-carrier-protein synthase II
MQEKIVVTGMGTVNPLGLSVGDSWERLIHGESGVGPITQFDAQNFLVQIACEVKDFHAENFLPAREARRRDRYEHLAAAAAQEAIRQAGLDAANIEPGRVSSLVSSAIGGIGSLQEAVEVITHEGPRRVGPFVIPMFMANGAAGLVAIDHGFRGPSFSIVSACASGADAIGTGWMMLKTGLIDVAITGASDACITKVAVAAFDRLGALSRRNRGETATPQPFDLNRDGFVMGEGAAVLVLERESHARSRGAEILAELAGYAATADAYHITAPSEEGAGGAMAMVQAMKSAGVNRDQVDYINAHGTATSLNDASETRAIKSAFGEQAYSVPISSTKSMTGHMMGTTGALEAIFCIQAVRENILPPTINYQTPDPECDLDYVPNVAREARVEVALSNSFGFGGHNAVLAIREYN